MYGRADDGVAIATKGRQGAQATTEAPARESSRLRTKGGGDVEKYAKNDVKLSRYDASLFT